MTPFLLKWKKLRAVLAFLYIVLCVNDRYCSENFLFFLSQKWPILSRCERIKWINTWPHFLCYGTTSEVEEKAIIAIIKQIERTIAKWLVCIFTICRFFVHDIICNEDIIQLFLQQSNQTAYKMFYIVSSYFQSNDYSYTIIYLWSKILTLFKRYKSLLRSYDKRDLFALACVKKTGRYVVG